MLLDYGTQSKLYVDTDGDNDLTDEEAYSTPQRPRRRRGLLSAISSAASDSSSGGDTVFGPITVPGRAPGGNVQFRVRPYGSGADVYFLLVEPAGARVGSVELNGAKHTVSIVDGNFDGRYDGVFDPSKGFDADWALFQGTGITARGAMLLPKHLRTEDGWYTVEVEPDGSAIAYTEWEPVFGTLDVGRDVKLSLLSDAGVFSLAGADGKWRLPEGKYGARVIQVSGKDDKDRVWTFVSSGESGKLSDFAIREGETLSLPLGPPFAARTEFAAYGDRNVSIGLALEGQAGERYSPGGTMQGRGVPPPRFRIIDEAGKVLVSSNFEYG
jgi:hypothetical protein